MSFLGWFIFTAFCSFIGVLGSNWFINKIVDNVL